MSDHEESKDAPSEQMINSAPRESPKIGEKRTWKQLKEIQTVETNSLKEYMRSKEDMLVTAICPTNLQLP